MQHWMHVARHCTLKESDARKLLKGNWRREWDSIQLQNPKLLALISQDLHPSSAESYIIADVFTMPNPVAFL
jgi:hypothetical protein